MKFYNSILLNISVILTLLLTYSVAAAEHNHQAMAQQKLNNKCKTSDINCAKTVTSAFAPNGDLWRLWSHKKNMYFQISVDLGKTFSLAKRVLIPAEKISSRNENRPKIAFDNFNGVYLSWAMPREKKYTADVRFSYSSDYGQTFSMPITVNNDKLLAGHSFNEINVSGDGDISIVWLDGRLSAELKKQGKSTNGSALYLAKGNIRKSGAVIETSSFSNQQLANNTCVCCRIAMDTNKQGELAIFWRHIYGDNIREFALLTLPDKNVHQQNETIPTPYQVSYDHWKINGCPHQGGGISIDEADEYHLVWFNQGDNGKGIFYASSTDQGKTLTKPLAIGKKSAQASHPHISQQGNNVDIVWTQYNGIEHQLWHQRSTDNGKSFSDSQMLTTSTTGADRPFIIKNGKVTLVSWQRPKFGHWVKVL